MFCWDDYEPPSRSTEPHAIYEIRQSCISGPFEEKVKCLLCYINTLYEEMLYLYEEAQQGLDEVQNSSWKEGYTEGRDIGYHEGYDIGYDEGRIEGRKEGHDDAMKKTNLRQQENRISVKARLPVGIIDHRKIRRVREI